MRMSAGSHEAGIHSTVIDLGTGLEINFVKSLDSGTGALVRFAVGESGCFIMSDGEVHLITEVRRFKVVDGRDGSVVCSTDLPDGGMAS